MAILKGHFTNTVFSNWETLYHVYRFLTDADKTIHVILRGSEIPQTGQTYILQGGWKNSRIYGWQFYTTRHDREADYTERHQHNIREIQMALI